MVQELVATGLRERKKQATRQHISDVATRLFIERGFEAVTVDEVATEAGVAKMTVFNYFARKEDLFFDRTADATALLESALAERGRSSPVAALRALAHALIAEGHPVTKTNRDVAASWRTVAESPALRARAFDLLSELETRLARALARSAGEPADDPVAHLIAATLLATWRIAFADTLRRRAPRTAFRDLVDRGFAAATALAAGTAYTRAATR